MRTRKELADVLRKRQLMLLPILTPQIGITREMIEKLSEDEIIDSYITCSGCGQKYATMEEVDQVLAKDPKTYDEFWKLLDRLVNARELARRGRE